MQYALIAISDDHKIIIDAMEIAALDNYKEGSGMTDFEPAEENLSLKLVYGNVMPQPDSNYEEIIKLVKESVGHALGFIHEGKCHLIELQDIILYDQLTNNYIPFAALISTDLNIQSFRQAITAFLRYGSMIPEDNILNRYGIISIKEEELNINKELTKENWKSFIREYQAVEVEECHHKHRDDERSSFLEALRFLEENSLLISHEDRMQQEPLTYVLTHTYDHEPRSFFISAPYSFNHMNALIAFIQLESSDIEETYGMDQTEVIKVLSTFYDCQSLEIEDENASEIDLYTNWETWAAPYGDVIQEIPQFKREGLADLLKTFIEE
ncbi:hypothetical protein D3C74_91190 [compost metagenome]